MSPAIFTTKVQVDLKMEKLDPTRKEITEMALQLKLQNGERMLVIISQIWQVNADILVDELQLLKKISQAKCFEIAQLKAKLKDSEGEFYMTVV